MEESKIQEPKADDSNNTPKWHWLVAIPLSIASLVMLSHSIQASLEGESSDPAGSLRPLPKSRIHRNDGKQYLWALGPRDPDDPESQWFDMTGSPLPLEEFEHGIGRDTITAIEEPRFAQVDDADFTEKMKWAWHQPEQIKVIGFAHAGEAHAYPIQLMNQCELVNDTVGGKPVTVGW